MSDIIRFDAYKAKVELDSSQAAYDKFCAARRDMLRALNELAAHPCVDYSLLCEEAQSTAHAVTAIPVFFDRRHADA